MVQIQVGDIFLDLYESDPPKLNFAIEDITDTSARSEFSQTFRIPATANNSQFFETAFEINGYDFDITQKIDAKLNVDGVLFREGELRLNNIYITRENEKIDYEVIFFGTTRSLATSIGESALCDLNLTDLEHELNFTAVTKSWEAYPSGTTTDGLFSGDVLYPLVDFGNTYDDDGDPIETRMAVGGGIHFTTNSNPLLLNRFKPMVRTKYLWDKIFEDAGFTYTSTFLDSDFFKKSYTSAWGNEPSVTVNSAISNLFFGQRLPSDEGYTEQPIQSVNTQIEYFSELYDYNNNFDLTTDYYTVPVTGTYQFGYSQAVRLEGTLTTIRNISFRLTKLVGSTPTTIGSDVNTLFAGDYNGNYFYGDDFAPVSLNAGDKVYMVVNPVTGLDVDLKGGSFYALDAPGDMNISFYLDCEKKQIDFVKDIITKYRLVLAADKNNSSNFIIEPWQDYIASGDLFDWTDKLDVSKDFKISPIFYSQKSKITFTDKEDGDFLNETYYDQFNEVFGTLNTFSNNELLEGDRKIETDLSPTPVTQIEGANQTTGGGNNHGMDNFIIPQVHTHSAEDTGTQHQPIKPNTRYLYYNGTKDTGITSQTTNSWKLEDEDSVLHSFDYYPMVSEYSDFPIEQGTVFFNWQKEDGYIKYDLLDITKGESVYDAYWSDYIDSLYDRWARRVTAYFVLNSQDLQEFSYDDVIFVKDAYYYVEKIYDVPLGEKASVKVDLIKLLDSTQIPQPTSAPLPPPSPTPTPTPTPTPSPITTDEDAADFLAAVVAAGGTLDANISGATDTFYKGLKSNNIWDKMILFYPFIGGTASAHSIQGIRASGTTYDLTMVGGITHGVSGATGNGSNSGMRTHFFGDDLPTTRGMGCYITDGTARAQYQMGGGSGDDNMIIISYGSSGNVGYVGFGSFKTYNPTTVGNRTQGNIVATINSSNQYNAYKNGSQVITNSSGTNNRDTRELSLLCDNRLSDPNFSVTETADSTMAFAWYSEFLTDVEMRTLSQLINTYQTSLGRNVH